MDSELIARLTRQWEEDNGPVVTQEIRQSVTFDNVPRSVVPESTPKERKPLKQTRTQQVLAYAAEHKDATLQSLAGALNMNEDYARSLLGDHGIYLRSVPTDRPQTTASITAKNYMEKHPGMSTKELVAATGVSANVIRTEALRTGYKLMRPRKIPRPSPQREKVEQMSALHPEWDNQQIAEAVEVTTEYVRRIRREIRLAKENNQ